MRHGLIRITGQPDLFYDSIQKEYRYRLHCPRCGKESGCWCRRTDNEDIPVSHCSAVHFVLDNAEDLLELANDMKITIKPTMEEWTAAKLVMAYFEDYDDMPDGKACAAE